MEAKDIKIMYKTWFSEETKDKWISEIDTYETWLERKLYESQIKSQKSAIPNVSGSSIPEPPKPPLCRVIREGVGHFCTNCRSTMPRSGFLILFGKRYCDNDKCPNSKPIKNYR